MRRTWPRAVFRASKSLARVSGRLSQACKCAEHGLALFSELPNHWRAFLDACRRLANAPNMASRCFQSFQITGARFWTLVAGFQMRRTWPRAVFRASKSLARVIERLSQACKCAERGLALFSELPNHWHAFLDACRRLANAPNMASRCFQSFQITGARFWTLVAGLQMRRTWPRAVFRASKSLARVIGRLSQAFKCAEHGLSLFSELPNHWHAFLDACRRLANAPNMASRCFQSFQITGARYWTLVAGFQMRRTWPRAVFRASKSLARVFGCLSQACKCAEHGLSLFSELPNHWHAFLDACRRLANAPNMASRCFQSFQITGARFWTLVAGFQMRRTWPRAVFRASKSLARVFGRLSQACKCAEHGLALFSEPPNHWRALLDACRRLANAPNVASRCFQSFQITGTRFWMLVAGLQMRRTWPRAVFRASKSLARVIGRLSQACKCAERGLSLFSELPNHWRALLDACRRLANAPNVASRCFQSFQITGARYWTLVAGLQMRRTWPRAVFRASKSLARVSGRLSQACKCAERGLALFSELPNHWRAFLDACRRLANAPNVASRCFQSFQITGARFWTLVAGLQMRRTWPRAVFRASKSLARVFGRLSQACKCAERGLALFSELPNHWRALLDACRRLANAPNVASRCFQSFQITGARFWTLVAGLQMRRTWPRAVFRASKSLARVIGRLSQACKCAERGLALFSELPNHWRAFLDACRRLANAPNVASRCFQSFQITGARFWTLVAGFQMRRTWPRAVFRASKSLARVFGRLSQACKCAERGLALFSELPNHWRAFLDACRRLANAPNVASRCFQSFQITGARFWTLVAGLQMRRTWPRAVFRASKSLARVFGRLSQACKCAERGLALFSELPNHWRALLDACRRLANAPNVASRCFQSFQITGTRFWTLVAGLQMRRTWPRAVFRASKSLARVFGRLSQACKCAEHGLALFSELPNHWRALLDACRRLSNAPNMASRCFQSFQITGTRFWTLVAGLQMRRTWPRAVFRASKSLARVIGRLSQAFKCAEHGLALFSEPPNHWRAFLDACRRLANAPNMASRCFQSFQITGTRFWTLVAGLQMRRTWPRAVFRASKSLARVSGRLSQAFKCAERGLALFSELPNHWRAFLDACRRLANAPNMASRCFQSLQITGARYWTLVAGLQMRRTWPRAVFRASKSLARVFGCLSQACKCAERGLALFSELPNHWRALLDACRRLANAPNVASRCFQSFQITGARYWTLVAGLQMRRTWPRAVFRASKSLARVFGCLSQACKCAERGLALFSELPNHWRALLDACRRLANAPNVASRCFQSFQITGARFWTLVAGLQMRRTWPRAVFRASKSLARVFGRLSQACKCAERGLALFSELPNHWRAFLDACRRLANAPNVASRCFQSFQITGTRFWMLVAGLQMRRTWPRAVFRASKSLARVSGRLSQACKCAERGLALFSELPNHWRAFLDACRRLANAPNVASRCFQSFQITGARFWTLVAGLQMRRTWPRAVFRASKSLARVFGRLSQAFKCAEHGLALFSELPNHWRAFLDACRRLSNAPNMASRCFQSFQITGARFWTLVAGLQMRRTWPRAVFRASKSLARVSGRLSQAFKCAERGLALFSELPNHWRAFLDACRSDSK